MAQVVLGPSGPGKTEWLLAHYRKSLHAANWGRCVWLAASPRAAAGIRDVVLAEAPVVLSPGVMTFGDLAESLSAHAPQSIRRLSSAARRNLLTQVVESAQKRGDLENLHSIADKRGFLDLLDDFVRTAERWGATPSTIAKSAGQRGNAARRRELALLLADYQEILARHRLSDSDRILWHAAELLSGKETARDKAWQLVVVDGFASFTAAQHAVLENLDPLSNELLISLPLPEDADNRTELFSVPQQTLKDLKRSHSELKIIRVPSDFGNWPAMDHLAGHLFSNPRNRPEPTREVKQSAGRIQIISASSEQDEIVQVAERVKRLLLSGETKAEDVGVVFRTLHEVAPRVEEVFGEFGIPYAIEVQRPLIAAPGVLGLIGLISLAVEDWPYRGLLAIINNRLLTALEPPPERGATAVAGRAAAERIVRELQISRGREELFKQLSYWADRLEREGGKETTGPFSVENLKSAQSLLSRLAEALDELPPQATPSQWLGALAELGSRFGLAPFAHPLTPRHQEEGELPNDRAAWERLEIAVKSVERLSTWLGESPPVWKREQALRQIRDIATHEFLPKPHGDAGRVRILSATTARTLSMPHIFLAGLAEKSFPRPDRAGRLYTDQDASSAAPRRQQEEMLLFYQVVTSATQSLTLSFAALDEKAQRLPPSPYLEEVQDVFGKNSPVEILQPSLSPITNVAPPLSPTQWQVAAVAQAVEKEDRDARLLSGMLADPRMASRGQSILAALRGIHSRSRGDSFGPMEGMFESDGTRRLLAQRFGAEHLWSPSQLEAYARCPYRFLMEHVFKLTPLRDLTLDADYMRRGMLLHEMLAEYHRRTAQGDADLLAILQERVEARGGSPMERALMEIEHRQIKQWARQYPDQMAAYQALWNGVEVSPQHLEIRFGPPHHGEGKASEDPRSTDEPFVLDVGDEQIRLTGRIDRIDVGQVGGRTVFTVIDYKSGKKHALKEDEMEAGRQLQLPLYVMAAQVLFFDKQQAVPVKAGYWSVSSKGFGDKDALKPYELGKGGPQASEDWSRREQALRKLVGRLIAGIRQGDFPMDNVDKDCTSICSFSTVCRVGQVRSLEKTRLSDAVVAAANQPTRKVKVVVPS